MPQVIILVGPSGCGKSTWANKFLADNAGKFGVICSADHYHMIEVDGKPVYKFDPAKAPMAHSACLNKFLKNIVRTELHYVIVDNTNISEWERQNYVQAAINAGCQVRFEVWTVGTVLQIQRCSQRNAHGVPMGVIADMALRYETPSGEFPIRFHTIDESVLESL